MVLIPYIPLYCQAVVLSAKYASSDHKSAIMNRYGATPDSTPNNHI